MRPSAIWREAWRDIATGTTRTLAYSLLLIVAVAGFAAAEFTTVRTITDAAAQYQASGASIITFAAPGRIDPRACEALNAVPGVRAAGALRTSQETLTPAALPSSTVPVFDVTATFPRVVDVTSTSAGIILSDQAAHTLALGVGERLVAREATTTVAGVYRYPDDGRRPGFAYAALAPTAGTGAFDECWVASWPISPQVPALVRMTLLPDDTAVEQPAMSQLNTTHGTTFDGAARYHARVTRHSPLATVAVGALLGYVAIRTRRTALAAALHVGVSRADVAAVLAIQTLSWILPAVTVLAAAAALAAATIPANASAIAVLATRVAVAAAAGPLAGGATAFLLTRERHLFRYFKDR